MEPVEVTRADVDVLAECWVTPACGMERYTELNELAGEEPEAARAGLDRQLDREDTPVCLIQPGGQRRVFHLASGDPSLTRPFDLRHYRRPVRRGRAQRPGPRQ